MQRVTQPRQQPRWRLVLPALLVAVVAFLTAFGAGVANAGTATSPFSYPSGNGVNYKAYATVITSTKSARATTQMGPQNVKSPQGEMGLTARLLKDNGALVCASSVVYSSKVYSVGTYFTQTSCTKSASGNWYSEGVTRVWQGQTYGVYYTFRSPNQSS